ncbi:MAG: type VI secretion system baseplate subunit TssF, partial [Rhodothermaceae bacterium]
MKHYNNDFLDYYKKELSYLRSRGQEFAEKYPKVAGGLDIGIDNSSDPHIERLIESFAFLTGRIQRNIDNEFPELSTSILNNVYPQLLTPVPSMTIAHFGTEDFDFPSIPMKIEKHHPLAAFTSEGQKCKFRTCYPVELWPVAVTFAGIRNSDDFHFLNQKNNTQVLQIRIKPTGDTSLADLDITSLKFHIHGDTSTANLIYETLFCSGKEVKIYSHEDEKTVLSDAVIEPVGFEKEEEVLPYPKNSNYGYRLLQEFFVLPEKFLFFDIKNIDLKKCNHYFDILIPLKKILRKEITISKKNFLLGCTPVINLFKKISEPIRIDNYQTEYKVNPDSHREQSTEIFAIESVSPTLTKEKLPDSIEPYFSFKSKNGDSKSANIFWYARKEESTRSNMAGQDLMLSLLNMNFEPDLPEKKTLYARVICTNRNIAGSMSAGMPLESEEKLNNLKINILKRPSSRIQAPKGKALWRLISALSLNYLSLGSDQASLESLREIVALFDYEN